MSAKKIRVTRASEAALVVLATADRWLYTHEIRKAMEEIKGPTTYRAVANGLQRLREAGLIRQRLPKSLGRFGTEAAMYRARPMLIRLAKGDQ